MMLHVHTGTTLYTPSARGRFEVKKIGLKFSWQGQASLGGYIGADIQSLVSSVVSGAAGTFVGTLTEDAEVLVDLTIEPAQVVVMVGLSSLAIAPAWGSGSFTVQERGSLTLECIRFEASNGITLQPGANTLTLRNCEKVNTIVSEGLEVPSGTTFTIQSDTPQTVVLGMATMAGHLVMRGPITLSNTNIITIAATAFDGASVTLEGGMAVYLPNRLVPVLDGSMPGTLTASVDGQTIGTLSTSDIGTVSSQPLGWYTTLEQPSLTSGGLYDVSTDPSSFWDSGDVVNTNGRTFSLYLLPAQPPGTFSFDGASARQYAALCAAAGLHTVAPGNRERNSDGDLTSSACQGDHYCTTLRPTCRGPSGCTGNGEDGTPRCDGSETPEPENPGCIPLWEDPSLAGEVGISSSSMMKAVHRYTIPVQFSECHGNTYAGSCDARGFSGFLAHAGYAFPTSFQCVPAGRLFDCHECGEDSNCGDSRGWDAPLQPLCGLEH